MRKWRTRKRIDGENMSQRKGYKNTKHEKDETNKMKERERG